jgi:hypothetical protein
MDGGSKGLLEWIWLEIQVRSSFVQLKLGISSGGSVRGRLLFLMEGWVWFDVRGWTVLRGLTSRHGWVRIKKYEMLRQS